MDGTFLIFILTLVTYIPLAVALLYVWWKYGKGETGVPIARTIFVSGSALLLFYLITI